MNRLNEQYHIEVYNPLTQHTVESNGNFSAVASAIRQYCYQEGFDQPQDSVSVGVILSGSIMKDSKEKQPITLFDTETYDALVASEDKDMLWLARVLQLAPRKKVSSSTY